MGFLMTASTAAAQNAPKTTSGGSITIGSLGTESVGSSKFTEYRQIPSGGSIPFVNLFTTGGKVDFNLTGYNVQQSDQRFLGNLKGAGMSLKFDWNQIPHDMGNNARSMFDLSAPGVWTMPDNLQQVLQTAVDTKLPTTARTYDFYAPLLAPAFASANLFSLSSQRKTGNVELNLGNRLPFDMTLSYKNEIKDGYRGLSSVNIRDRVSSVTEVASPLDEMTYDLGVRAARNFKSGNVYASVNRNVYDNRAQTMMLDYAFQAYDTPVTAASGSIPALGGTSRERFVMAPDNAATTGSAGFMLKFKRQTRISGSVGLSTRTQDASFYPYTANTAVNTAAGVPASSLAALPQRSYGGKVNTTTYNVSFSTKPVDGLNIRAQYRLYDLADKSNKWAITGDMSGGNAAWSVVTPTTADPYGHATANIYDTKNSRFTASATYDYRALTLEGQVRSGKLERTSREATSGNENGMAVTALLHASDWLRLRGTYDLGKRTAAGETLYGFQSDEAAFENTRTGIDIELTPTDGLDLTLAYFRRNVDFTGRPNRIVVASGAPVAGVAAFPNTPSGLLGTKFDSYTGEINYAPGDRFELGAFYTYEKDASTNQWSTTQGSATAGYSLNNLLNYAGSNKTNTFGANAVFQVVPDKHTFMLNAVQQKVDGLMDITAREAGSFYTPGRTTLIPSGRGGAADITDWDDTEVTSLSAQWDFAVMRGWTVSAGYMYEKYDFKDAFNSTSTLLPQSMVILTKPNDGAYNANLLFARLKYSF
jgi:hypothetical protein